MPSANSHAESGGGEPAGGGGRQYLPSAEKRAPGMGAHGMGVEGDEVEDIARVAFDVTGKTGTVLRDLV